MLMISKTRNNSAICFLWLQNAVPYLEKTNFSNLGRKCSGNYVHLSGKNYAGYEMCQVQYNWPSNNIEEDTTNFM